MIKVPETGSLLLLLEVKGHDMYNVVLLFFKQITCKK